MDSFAGERCSTARRQRVDGRYQDFVWPAEGVYEPDRRTEELHRWGSAGDIRPGVHRGRLASLGVDTRFMSASLAAAAIVTALGQALAGNPPPSAGDNAFIVEGTKSTDLPAH